MKNPTKESKPRKMKPVKMWAAVSPDGKYLKFHRTKTNATIWQWAGDHFRLVRVEIREI